MSLAIERVYDFAKRDKAKGEYAVLVDRLWPRGIAKADLAIDEWPKEIAPSTGLRKWFAHDPARWDRFREAYLEELEGSRDTLERLRRLARRRRVLLLYGARNVERNHAHVLREAIGR